MEEQQKKLTELGEEHQLLQSSALKLELSFKGCFTEYMRARTNFKKCSDIVDRCDAAYNEQVEALNDAKATYSWFGLPGWAWAIIGGSLGAMTGVILTISATR